MKLNVKVIAAVLGLVTMAMMLAACTREVIKEVPVTQVVTETVVKEVPVEVVVEKEVVKEVPVQRVVEVEVIKEVEVPVERVVEKEVVREVERPVVVEKEVVREVEVFKEVSVAEKAPAREVTKPVIVEKEVVREVMKVVEVEVSGGSTGPRRPSTSPAPTSRSGGTPPATTFRDYQRERFVSAVRDAVSTFSLDTDRTSYYLALNWARTGYRVEPDSVRQRSGSTLSTTATSRRSTATASPYPPMSSGTPWTAGCTSRASPSRRPTSATTARRST